MRDDAETVSTRAENRKGWRRTKFRAANWTARRAAVVSPLQQGHGCTSGDGKAYSRGGQVVERSKPRPDGAFLVICSVKLFEEAVPPGSLEHKVICPVK